MESSPLVEPIEGGAPLAADAIATKPTTDVTPDEASGAQDSGPGASPTNNPSSTRQRDETTDTETATLPGQTATEGSTTAGKGSEEDGKIQEQLADKGAAEEGAASPPPLPDEPLPEEQENDDGWDPMWSDEHQAWYFYNRLTQQTQWDNPRVSTAGAAVTAAQAAGGYNPAVHGDYDPTAWYATGGVAPEEEDEGVDSEAAIAAAAAAAAAVIQSTDPNAFRGSRPDAEFGSGSRYSQDAKTARQLNAYFDVAATGSEHDGRSLKAERSGKKPTKAELKAFKEKRRAKKEEKRRAWLRD